jgi:hypothetical protein
MFSAGETCTRTVLWEAAGGVLLVQEQEQGREQQEAGQGAQQGVTWAWACHLGGGGAPPPI